MSLVVVCSAEEVMGILDGKGEREQQGVCKGCQGK